MKILSVSEFSRFCEEIKPVAYIYSTDNQPGARQHPLRASLRFSKIIISLKPDRICFINDLDKLCFERVKEVRLRDDKPSIGTVFSIICDEQGRDIAYTLIAD